MSSAKPASLVRASVHAPGGVSMELPTTIAEAGDAAARLTLQFLTSELANEHTRRAYGRAIFDFCAWCEAQHVALGAITPPTIAAYYTHRRQSVSLASIKLIASALRHWLDYLTTRGALPLNPALSVRTPRLIVGEGKTPVLERDEARKLFDVLEGTDLLTLRDRALIALMIFSFARVGAAISMRVRDFQDEGGEAFLVLHEKGGKERRLPCHHRIRAYLRAYLDAAGLDPKSKEPLFQSAPRTGTRLSGRPLTDDAVLRMVKRRCVQAGLPSNICNHSFRATGITIHQQNGGRLEDAQDLAGHADARTTRLYVRTRRTIARSEVERVQL